MAKVAIILVCLALPQIAHAKCDAHQLRLLRYEFLKSLGTPNVRTSRVHPRLRDYDRNLQETLATLAKMSARRDHDGALKHLKEAEIFTGTGIKIVADKPIEITVDEVKTFVALLRNKDYGQAYDNMYMEEISALSDMPQFFAEKLEILIPGDVIVVNSKNERLPISEVHDPSFFPAELRDFIIQYKMLTKLEEVFHAADHTRFSLDGTSASPAFNHFLKELGLRYEYSRMTETAFAFYVIYDVKSAFLLNPVYRHKFLDTYKKERAIVLNPVTQELMGPFR